jgi:hypothetical protein
VRAARIGQVVEREIERATGGCLVYKGSIQMLDVLDSPITRLVQLGLNFYSNYLFQRWANPYHPHIDND